MTLEQSLQLGLNHHRGGRWSEAERVYRQVLEKMPNQPEALHLLGVLSRTMGRAQAAVDLIRRVVAIKPRWPEAWYNLGNACRDAGETNTAMDAYRQAVALNPGFTDARISLGNMLIDRGSYDEATASFRAVIAIRPGDMQALGNLGTALMGKQDFEAAAAAYEKAIVLHPDFYQAISNLGIAMKEMGKLTAAVVLQERAIQLNPNYAIAHRNLGSTRQTMGEFEAAASSYRLAVALKPNYHEAFVGLGDVLRETGQLDAAIDAYRSALAIKPNSPQVLTILGNVLKLKGDFTEAVASHRQALALDPDLAEAHSNLGSVLKDGWRIDEAIAECEKAIELKPDFANAYGNLSQALLLAGESNAAMEASRQVIRLEPEKADAHGGYIFAMNYLREFDAATIAGEQAVWNDRHAEPLRRFIVPHTNDRDPDRSLRIGYVSADFWAHPVGRFLLPLLENHDRSHYQIFAYSQATVADVMTDQLKGLTDRWISVVGLSDPQMAEQIKHDQIDILVDLSLHTAGNRLLVFARKPAPVQMTWLGYPGSTGLRTMDYRLSDPHLDPEDADVSRYSERTVRLPDTFWCYRTSQDAGEVAHCPARQQGHVTFGCLNHFGKVTPGMFQVWMRLLRNLPQATLLLHVASGQSRERVLRQCIDGGVSSDRLMFEGRMHPRDYFKCYSKIDIALDTSPFAGGTTTCDALWMGVPVVTLRGRTVIGRGGCSILSNVGLRQLVADTEEQYVEIATRLAGNIEALEHLRRNLRQMMSESPLMDATRFARNMETAYRTAWKSWCEQQRDPSGADDRTGTVPASQPHSAETTNWRDDIGAIQHLLTQRISGPTGLNDAAAGNSLGNALRDRGQLYEAVAAYRKAIALHPTSAVLQNNLGSALQSSGKPNEAIDAYRRAIAIQPKLVVAHENLGIALKETGELDEAMTATQRAIGLHPGSASAHANLAHVMLLSAQLDAALIANRKAMQLEPDNPGWHSNYIFCLQHGSDAAALAVELRDWNRRHAEPITAQAFSHHRPTERNRRLRIGYVSADFRRHAVARFLEPLFAHHDRTHLEIFAYSDVRVVDQMTDRLKSHLNGWLDTTHLADTQLADQIHSDRIDILIDLALHTTPNRLLVFARKPAPIQLTWLGYPGSTGLTSIDYRLSDRYLDPLDTKPDVYSEDTIRLANSYWCYQPSEAAPSVGPVPAERAGHVTFGCLNQFSKISSQAVSLWARILKEVPGSRMLLHAPGGNCRIRLTEQFDRLGVSADRVEYSARLSEADYFELYNQIDLALDTLPFAGGTTTCDALWMGVPVVTLKGQTVVGRSGCSILFNVGLPELVTNSESEYVLTAVDLAKNVARLDQLRDGLRQRMSASKLMDAAAFARDMERVFRTAWHQWCVVS